MGEGCDRRPGALRGKQQLRVAVIGHGEHVTIASAPRLPTPGEFVHLDDVVTNPGGGGGLAFFQLTWGPAEVHLFTAFVAILSPPWATSPGTKAVRTGRGWQFSDTKLAPP